MRYRVEAAKNITVHEAHCCHSGRWNFGGQRILQEPFVLGCLSHGTHQIDDGALLTQNWVTWVLNSCLWPCVCLSTHVISLSLAWE